MPPLQVLVEPEPVVSRAFMQDFHHLVAGDRIAPLAGHADRQVGPVHTIENLVIAAACIIDRCVGDHLLGKIGRHKVRVFVTDTAFPVPAGRQIGEIRIPVIVRMPRIEMILRRQVQRLRLFPQLVIGREGLLVLLARVLVDDLPVSIIELHAFVVRIVENKGFTLFRIAVRRS